MEHDRKCLIKNKRTNILWGINFPGVICPYFNNFIFNFSFYVQSDNQIHINRYRNDDFSIITTSWYRTLFEIANFEIGFSNCLWGKNAFLRTSPDRRF